MRGISSVGIGRFCSHVPKVARWLGNRLAPFGGAAFCLFGMACSHVPIVPLQFIAFRKPFGKWENNPQRFGSQRMIANPVRECTCNELAGPWKRGDAVFGLTKSPVGSLASLCLPAPTIIARPSESPRSKKKICQREGQWFYARCGSGLLTTPPPRLCPARLASRMTKLPRMPRACGFLYTPTAERKCRSAGDIP